MCLSRSSWFSIGLYWIIHEIRLKYHDRSPPKRTRYRSHLDVLTPAHNHDVEKSLSMPRDQFSNETFYEIRSKCRKPSLNSLHTSTHPLLLCEYSKLSAKVAHLLSSACMYMCPFLSVSFQSMIHLHLFVIFTLLVCINLQFVAVFE